MPEYENSVPLQTEPKPEGITEVNDASLINQTEEETPLVDEKKALQAEASHEEELSLVGLLNTGDRKELKAFLNLYAPVVYERALLITNNEELAQAATHSTLMEAAIKAGDGLLDEEIDFQMMTLTDAAAKYELRYGADVLNAAKKSGYESTHIVGTNLFDDESDVSEDLNKNDSIFAERESGISPFAVVGILLISILLLVLIWFLLIKLAAAGLIQIEDFGFADWFNSNVFDFF